MWITKNYNEKFQQEYKIESKLLEASGIKHHLEIFNSQAFENIALIDDKILLKTMLPLQSELLAHISACSHKEPKKILIAGSFNLEIAFEFLRHKDLKVDFLQFDLKILESLISFFPHYQSVMQNKRFNLIPQQKEEFLQQNQVKTNFYDIIILENKADLKDYESLLGEDGILVIKSPHLLLETTEVKKQLELLDGSFRVKMRFYIPMSLDIQDFYLFASKRFHPTADIMLQKADMLEDLEYYHANLHLAAFVIPKGVRNALFGAIRN